MVVGQCFQYRRHQWEWAFGKSVNLAPHSHRELERFSSPLYLRNKKRRSSGERLASVQGAPLSHGRRTPTTIRSCLSAIPTDGRLLTTTSMHSGIRMSRSLDNRSMPSASKRSLEKDTETFRFKSSSETDPNGEELPRSNSYKRPRTITLLSNGSGLPSSKRPQKKEVKDTSGRGCTALYSKPAKGW